MRDPEVEWLEPLVEAPVETPARPAQGHGCH